MMARLKAENDPWTPLPEKIGGISQPPCDPRYQLIDSDRYIETLERKLKRLKGRNKPEPSSRDIIDSLVGFKDDQMRRFLHNGHTAATQSTPFDATDVTSSPLPATYLQRRLHPERQALNMEELFELLKDDELARNRQEEEEEEAELKPAPGAECAQTTENYKGGDQLPSTDHDPEAACDEGQGVSENGCHSEQGQTDVCGQGENPLREKNDDVVNCEGEEQDTGKSRGEDSSVQK